jgi:sarcosine oxidase subunit alpha
LIDSMNDIRLKDNKRIFNHPILKFQRGKLINIFFEGQKLNAYEGETVAAALIANGKKCLHKSLKFSRPRGFFCSIGKCSSCLMRVNSIPNVRTCIEPVKNGMKIEMERGQKIEQLNNQENRTEKIRINTDVIVVGAGPAGLSAAITAAELNLNVLIIDENIQMGGQLIKQSHKFFGTKDTFAGTRGTEVSNLLIDQIKKNEKQINWLTNTSALGYFEGKKHTIAAIQNNQRLLNLKTEKIILATGAQEKILQFPNNDLPGVYGAGAVQTLMNVYGVKPGNDAIIIGAGNVGTIIGYQMIQAGINVRMIIDAAKNIGGYLVHASKLRRLGIPILTSYTIKRAIGNDSVESAVIVKLDKDWLPIEGTEKEVEVDLICIAIGLSPSSELAFQAGCKSSNISELGGQVALHNKDLETTREGFFVSGDVSGIEEASTAMVEGKLAASNAALQLAVSKNRAQHIKKTAFKDLQTLRQNPFSKKIVIGKSRVYDLWEKLK